MATFNFDFDIQDVDTQQWMSSYIKDRIPAAPYVSGLVAREIYDSLKRDRPDLLMKWLAGRAESMIHAEINRMDRSLRATARHHASRSVFRDAVSAAEAGDAELLKEIRDGNLSNSRITIAANARKRLADCVSDDLEQATGSYQRRAQGNLLMAAFLRVIQEELAPGEKVSDKFDEDRLQAMWRNLGH